MKRLIIGMALAAACVAGAEQQIQSGDVVQIGDYQYVVVGTAQWERLQLTIADIRAKYAGMMSNEYGRVALHGARKNMSVTNGLITVNYADGFAYSEKAKNYDQRAKRPRPSGGTRSVASASAKPAAKRNDWRADIRAKRAAALSKTNSVTVVKEVK